MDFQIFITQFLTADGAGLSGYFYSGRIDLPTGASDGSIFQDKYLRYAIFGTLPISQFQVLAGFQQGTDNSFDTLIMGKGNSFTNSGWFGEADYQIAPLVGVGVRYDQFDPWTASPASDKVNAIAGFINYAVGNGLQFVAEYQSIGTQQGSLGKETDGNFGINIIWIH